MKDLRDLDDNVGYGAFVAAFYFDFSRNVFAVLVEEGVDFGGWVVGKYQSLADVFCSIIMCVRQGWDSLI